MRIVLAAICLVMSLFPFSCSESTLSQDLESNVHPVKDVVFPSVMFAITSTNWAKGFHHSGCYIDESGSVDTFTYSQSDSIYTFAEDSVISISEMSRMLQPAQSSGRQIEPSLLDSMIALAREAAVGPLSPEVPVCCDYGTLTYSVYIHDSSVDAYQEVLLYQAGNFARVNQSQAAQKLTVWLMSLDGRTPEEQECSMASYNASILE